MTFVKNTILLDISTSYESFREKAKEKETEEGEREREKRPISICSKTLEFAKYLLLAKMNLFF